MKKTLALAVLVFSCVFSLASTKAQRNALGVEINGDNPYIYLLGSVLDGAFINDPHEVGTSVRFHEAFTPVLQDKTVLFCGEHPHWPGGIIVVTYTRAASRKVNGVACHTLISINSVQENK